MTEMNQIKTLLQHLRGKKKYDYILAPARGGLVPAQFIAYALDIKTIHTLTNVKGLYPRSQPTMNVLLVDDINDTSATINDIVNYMYKHKLCGNIDVAVLFERYSAPIKADFVGEVINHDDYIHFTWDKEIV